MVELLHYLPYFLGAALVLLALAVMFGDDIGKKRSQPERPRRHYAWNDRGAHRD